MRARGALLALMLMACDGLGRPVVGTRPVPDGGEELDCDVTPACVPVRTVPTSTFTVPAERRMPPEHVDCDGDGIDDAVDNCPGVPNEYQDPRACAAAEAACAALRNGATNLEGADLRGCRWEGEAPRSLTLRGADLRCASLSLTAPEMPAALDLSGADLTNAALSIASEAALVVELGRATLLGTFVQAAGGVRLRVRESVLANATLTLAPGGSAYDPAPALELSGADVDSCAIHETPGPWPGQVRVERSTVRGTTFEVAALDLVGGTVVASNLGAEELFLLDVELRSSAVSAGYGAFAMTKLRDVIVARCGDLHLTGAVVEDVDVALCEPDRLRIVGSEILGSRFAGGLWLIESRLAASILGADPSSVVQTTDAELEAVTICDLGAAAFRRSALRCVKCEDDAFMDGTTVCLAGSHIFERGCPAIELAPECS